MVRHEEAKEKFNKILSGLDVRFATAQSAALVRQVYRLNSEYIFIVDDITSRRKAGQPAQALVTQFERELQPIRDKLEAALDEYVAFKTNQFDLGKKRFKTAGLNQVFALVLISILAILLAATLSIVFGRTLIRLYEEAEKATRLREEVVAIVSHDLRNPLSALGMNLSLLKRILATSGEHDRAIHTFQVRLLNRCQNRSPGSSSLTTAFNRTQSSDRAH